MAANPAKLPKPLNLLVFLPDQQRADTVSATGAAARFAPNLCRLASQAAVFKRAYVSQPVCSPSRSTLLSGTWPHANGVCRNSVPLPPRIAVLPELLREHEYQAGYFGKWHLGEENVAQRQFPTWISTEGVSDYQDFLRQSGVTPDRPNGSLSLLAQSELPYELSKPRFLERQACRFLDEHRSDPFILFVAFAEPHSPYNGPFNREHPRTEITPSPLVGLPARTDLPLRYRLLQEWQQNEAAQDRVRHDDLFYFGITPEECLRIKQRYLGLVTLVDLSIGAILAHLENLGLAETTIVVHTSDHGDMLGDHHLFAKEVMFESAVRVPYLIRLPGQQRPMLFSQPVSHIDFIPTLLDLLGQPTAPQCAGQSLARRLQTGDESTSGDVFIEWSPNRIKLKRRSTIASPRQARKAMQESTRTIISPEGWKLSLRNRDTCELYHLKSDRLEMHNLFSDSRHRDIVQKYSKKIFAWQQATDDPLTL